MKKNIVSFLLFLACQFLDANAQPIINAPVSVGSGKFSFSIDVNTPNTGLGPLITPDAIKTKTQKNTIPFLEFGDGAFSTEANPIHEMGKQEFEPLLFAAGIYDTTRPKATRIGILPKKFLVGNNKSNDKTIIPNGKKIFITPNVNDIVPGDLNTFAITYILPDSFVQGVYFKVIFFYNTNKVFHSLGISDKTEIGVNSIRNFYNDIIDPTTVPITYSGLRKPGSNFSNCIVVSATKYPATERNVFVTLSALPDVEYNTTTNIYAMLIRSNNSGDTWNMVDDYLINSMPVAEAHDPNYIRQTGQCILLPKDKKVIKYHIHFQNDGKGEAGKVDVKIRLPLGIKKSDITLGSANCGGNSFNFTPENIKVIPDSNFFIFTFSKDNLPFLLKGVENNTNPYTNPNTMGDIFFSVPENVITTDTLPSYADIYFYNLNSDVSLAPVRTNLAASVYRFACDKKPMKISVDVDKYWGVPPCKTCVPSCFKILSICWYWWLLLLLLILICYWVYKKYKFSITKNAKEDGYK